MKTKKNTYVSNLDEDFEINEKKDTHRLYMEVILKKLNKLGQDQKHCKPSFSLEKVSVLTLFKTICQGFFHSRMAFLTTVLSRPGQNGKYCLNLI